MAQSLRRFTVPVTRPWLYRLLENPDSMLTEPVDGQATLKDVKRTVISGILALGTFWFLVPKLPLDNSILGGISTVDRIGR